MFDIVLYQPEIPPNTGNIIRLCANSGARLHLIEPLGFELNDKRLRRAGLDYHEWADIQVHPSLDSYLDSVRPMHVRPLSTRGRLRHDQVRHAPGEALLFGPETRGLPDEILQRWTAHSIRIPMRPGCRSLNLSNAVAILVYEAWRQQGFTGGE